MLIELCEQALDAWQRLQQFHHEQLSLAGKAGATSVFVGTMRDFNQGDEVVAMTLEDYPGMTERQVGLIVEEAQQQLQVLDVLVVHRTGPVNPNESLVLVAVWSAHRGDAFDASRFIMEQLKSRAPFWKQETLASGELRWVEKNTGGYLNDL